MVCDYCGEEFTGRAVRQGGQSFCSIECADLAAEVDLDDLDADVDDGMDDSDDAGYYEEDELDLNPIDDDDLI